MSNKQQGFGIIGFIALTIAVLLIGATAWLFWKNIVNKSSTESATKQTASQQTTTKKTASLPPMAPVVHE